MGNGSKGHCFIGLMGNGPPIACSDYAPCLTKKLSYLYSPSANQLEAGFLTCLFERAHTTLSQNGKICTAIGAYTQRTGVGQIS